MAICMAGLGSGVGGFSAGRTPALTGGVDATAMRASATGAGWATGLWVSPIGIGRFIGASGTRPSSSTGGGGACGAGLASAACGSGESSGAPQNLQKWVPAMQCP
jgi:hypothetical protein